MLSWGPPGSKHASPSSIVQPAGAIVPHGGQSATQLLASSPAVQVPSPHVLCPEPHGPRNASNDARVPFQRSMSTPVVIPFTMPLSVYCQKYQVGHGTAMFGHGVVEYC